MYYLDQPIVGREEKKYLSQCIRTGWISSQGPFVKKFEKKFAKYVGVKYAISCASGTSAISLLFQTLKLNKGDEVIMPALTFSADGYALMQSGAKLIFADTYPGSFCINIEDVLKKITKKTKLIFPTHLYGFPSDIGRLKKICLKNKIYLVEDCSQAIGSIFKKKKLGSFGDLNIHSFHNKLIASGEGGMITTNNRKLAKRFELLKTPPSVNRPEEMGGFKEISLNHRMSNLHAAVGLAQLERLEKNIKKKNEMAKIYNKIFEKTDKIIVIKPKKNERVVYWRYTILLSKKVNLEKFIFSCKKEGIVVRKTYLPLHLHPVFKIQKKLNLPNCEQISKSGVDIPSGINLNKKDFNIIGNKILNLVEKLAK